MNQDNRAAQLVTALGALTAMATEAIGNDEVTLAARLAGAAEEAAATLARIDAERSNCWRDMHLNSELVRTDVAKELRGMAESRFFTPPTKLLLSRAASMLAVS